MSIGSELAGLARGAVERHTEWDSPHVAEVIHRDGDSVRPTTVVVIDTALHPDQYPLVIRKLVAGCAERNGPPYALLLQIEGHSVRLPPPGTMSVAEEDQLTAARRDRTLHQRPDAVEIASAWVVDVTGRSWLAVKTRGEDGIGEYAFEAGDSANRIGGQMQRGLTSALAAYGETAGEEAGSGQDVP